MRKNILTGIVLLAVTAIFLTAERKKDIAFDHITIENGLSQSSVNCIFQDSKGFMWFGTYGGLNKYDGNSFTVYNVRSNTSHGLRGRFIYDIKEDASGTLWLATRDKGLHKFNGETETFTWYSHDRDNPNTPGADSVLALEYDRGGILWLGTQGAGLDKFDPKTGTFTHYKNDGDNPHSLSHNTVTAIYQDRTGTLWVGTQDGLNTFNPQTGTFFRYSHDPTNPSGPGNLCHPHVQAIHEDHGGTIWIGTRSGLDKLDRQTGTFTHYKKDLQNRESLSDNNVMSIYEDGDNTLWIGTNRGGIDVFNREKETFTCYKHDPRNPWGLSTDSITAIYQDRSGVLWFGTGYKGIHTLDKNRNKFSHYYHQAEDPKSISGNSVFTFHRDRAGILWIGMLDGGLDKFDLEKGVLIRNYRNEPGNPDSMADSSVLSIYGDREGMLWVGTWRGGLDRFDPEKETFTHYRHDPADPGSISSDAITCICEDREGNMWLGVGTIGLDKLDVNGKTISHFRFDPQNPAGLSNDSINCIHEDRSGILWIGTRGGLNRLDRETEKFTCYSYKPDDPTSLSDDSVSAVCEPETGGSSSILWVGTWDGGLNKLDRESGTFTRYGCEKGLPDETVYAILEDARGNLWISTNRGISRFNPLTGRFTNYGPRDGIQDYEYNHAAGYISPDGEMFFGGINGFNAFFPAKIKDNPYVPPVVITGFNLLNEPAGSGGVLPAKISLSYKQNIFLLRFAALDYTNPSRNQYKYKVEGLHDDWVYLGNKHEITFTGLEPGKYVFTVTGSNNDGVWNEEGASLQIVITPPFWRTLWFRVLVVLLLGCGVYAWFRSRMKRLARQLETEKAMNRLYTKHQISAREQEILNLIIRGKSNKEIEDTLFISLSTVKTHVYNIYKKMKVKNRVELLRLIQQSVNSTQLEAEKVKIR